MRAITPTKRAPSKAMRCAWVKSDPCGTVMVSTHCVEGIGAEACTMSWVGMVPSVVISWRWSRTVSAVLGGRCAKPTACKIFCTLTRAASRPTNSLCAARLKTGEPR